MHALWPLQAVSREQLADDGSVRSERFDCEHHAGVSTGLAAWPRVRYSQEVVSDFKRTHVLYKMWQILKNIKAHRSQYRNLPLLAITL